MTLIADALALEAVAAGAAHDAGAGRRCLDLNVHDGRTRDDLGDREDGVRRREVARVRVRVVLRVRVRVKVGVSQSGVP